MDDKSKDVKEVKSTELVNNIINVWENVVESSLKEKYVEVVVQLKMFLNYVESIILNSVNETFCEHGQTISWNLATQPLQS